MENSSSEWPNLTGAGHFDRCSFCSNGVRGLGAAMKKLAHSASLCVGDNNIPSHCGTKYLTKRGYVTCMSHDMSFTCSVRIVDFHFLGRCSGLRLAALYFERERFCYHSKLHKITSFQMTFSLTYLFSRLEGK